MKPAEVRTSIVQTGVSLFYRKYIVGVQPPPMKRLAPLQIIGPATIFIAACCGELSAAALAHWPSSELLWRANLEWFHALQKSSYALSAFGTIHYAQLWLIAVPLIAM